MLLPGPTFAFTASTSAPRLRAASVTIASILAIPGPYPRVDRDHGPLEIKKGLNEALGASAWRLPREMTLVAPRLSRNTRGRRKGAPVHRPATEGFSSSYRFLLIGTAPSRSHAHESDPARDETGGSPTPAAAALAQQEDTDQHGEEDAGLAQCGDQRDRSLCEGPDRNPVGAER